MAIDYTKVGFKAGLEIHQQLDSATKLFCNCPTVKSTEFPKHVLRRLRPSASELGTVDAAAAHEFVRNRSFIYDVDPATACLVELDEEPPSHVNPEALAIALQACKVLGSEPVDELHIMRKVVIDGSTPSAFQRTALLSLGGAVATSRGEVRIATISLEEDAAPNVHAEGESVHYRLDRLGVPLIEIGTEPDIKDAAHLKETALIIGTLLRTTGRMKRGIGSIRQDLNISVAVGDRVEIKGAQELAIFETFAEYEAMRQLALVAVRDELKKRGALVSHSIVELSDVFKDSGCRFVNAGIKKGDVLIGARLPKFAGLVGKEVCPGRRVGTELSDYAKTRGVGGLIHSDEDLIGKYKFAEAEIAAARKALGCAEGDAFMMVLAPRNVAESAMTAAIGRASQFFVGVPRETRNANPDGTSTFMRPLAGAARLYPETDVPSSVIDRGAFDAIPMPESPQATKKRLKKLGLNDDLVDIVAGSQSLFLFNRIVEETKAAPMLVATTLEYVMTALAREGVPVEDISDDRFVELFKLKDVPKEALPDLLKAMATDPSKPVGGLMSKGMDEKAVRAVVAKAVKANPDALSKPTAFNIIMGEAMKELRGKADGGVIAKAVKDAIAKS